MKYAAPPLVVIAAISAVSAIELVRGALDMLGLRYTGSWLALAIGLILTPLLGAFFGSTLLRMWWRFDRARRDDRTNRARQRDETGRFR